MHATPMSARNVKATFEEVVVELVKSIVIEWFR